jgi:hypothetical protein
MVNNTSIDEAHYRPCAGTHILHYLPQGGELSPRGSWGICALALPEVLTHSTQECARARVVASKRLFFRRTLSVSQWYLMSIALDLFCLIVAMELSVRIIVVG